MMYLTSFANDTIFQSKPILLAVTRPPFQRPHPSGLPQLQAMRAEAAFAFGAARKARKERKRAARRV